MVLGQAVNMSLMDISKIFSLLQPKEEDEDNEQCQALNNAVNSDNVTLLSELLSQESYRRSINARSGWGVPVTPLRTAAALGHLRCLEVLLEHGAEVSREIFIVHLQDKDDEMDLLEWVWRGQVGCHRCACWWV